MPNHLQVLIIEDDDDDALLFVRHLRRNGYEVRHQRVDRLEDLTAALSLSQWDLVLCDYNLQELDPLVAMREVQGATDDVPFIGVSGSVSEEKLVELMKAGANDVILKDQLTRLAPAIERELEEAQNRRQRKRAELRLREAIESISEGFALYDSNDRLVVCNDIYRNTRQCSADLLVPGARYEDIIRQEALFGEYPEAEGRVEEWIAERLAQHQACNETVVQRLSDGRWLLVSEHRTSDGGHVSIWSDITELKERENQLAELAQKNEILAAAIWNTSNGMLITDPNKPDNPIIFTNRAFTTLTGYSAEEAIGRNCRFLQGEGTDKETTERIRRAIEEQRPVATEIRNYKKDGTPFWQELRISPIFGDAGQVDYFVGTLTDITARRQTEAALRESQKRFSSLVSNIAGAVYRGACDENWTMSYMSDAIEELSGYPASDFINNKVRSYASIIFSEDVDFVEESVLGAVERKEPFTMRYRILHADGEVRWVWERGVGVFDDNGTLMCLDGVIFDISEQQRAEEALRASELRLAAILDSAMEAVVSIDDNGRIQGFNRGAETVFGYRAEEVMSLPVDVLIPDQFQAAHKKHLSTFLTSPDDDRHKGRRMRMAGLRKDGTEFPAEASISKLQSDGQTVLTAMLHDISDRVAAEAQLQQAQKMEAVGRLTGGIAHDFNNLLTVILGNARLLERRLEDDESLAPKANAISAAAKRGASLVARLLAFSRKESLETKVIDGRALVSDMLDMLRRTLGETIEIRTQLTDESLILMADPNQLEAALLNLATNARDAMPNGGQLSIEMETIRIREEDRPAGLQLAAGDYVVLSVSDTGSGIPADQLDRIFEPFFTTKDVGKGTGLGLSMAFGFAKQSGGQILVESEEGKGATFRIYLPRSETSAEGAAADDEAAQCRAEPHGRETILVVEDEEDVRRIAVSILEDLGYQVIQAESGPDALAKLEAQPSVDLLFTDMIMPGGMTGYELAQEAKQRRSGLKVLYTSGYADDALGSASDEIRLVRKPYEDGGLAREVKAVLAEPA